MHTIRDIARLATMLAGLIAPRLRLGFVSALPQLRLDYALASISCEHCRSSRNHPHCVPRHIIYYDTTQKNTRINSWILVKSTTLFEILLNFMYRREK